ncbi:hypothetical protein AVEN_162840-1 [Araneus ventricosus]|uniref:Uncharacterized protein n=1 Tax=Araneus ventricosus TaxID=182803 RepID=A0A4Y2C7U9_ARAVE|nr:hypothetical protein AVEN_162840-1 [Araneus ventricosus]
MGSIIYDHPVLWKSAKCLSSHENIPEVSGIVEWMSFMQVNQYTDKSAIKSLPFVNLPPSDANTLYTALKYAAEDRLHLSSKICLVTFDYSLGLTYVR